jgi:energy-coupling factor transporter transmembrane protein EcfT
MYCNPFLSPLFIISLPFPSYIYPIFTSISFILFSFYSIFCLCLPLHWFLSLPCTFITPLLLYIISSWLPQSALFNLINQFLFFQKNPFRPLTTDFKNNNKHTHSFSTSDLIKLRQRVPHYAVTAVWPVGMSERLLSTCDPAQFQVHICCTRMIREYHSQPRWKQILSCQAMNKLHAVACRCVSCRLEA